MSLAGSCCIHVKSLLACQVPLAAARACSMDLCCAMQLGASSAFQGGTAQTALRDRDSPGSSRCSGLNAQSCQSRGHLPEYGNSFQICPSLGTCGALIPGAGWQLLAQGWGEGPSTHLPRARSISAFHSHIPHVTAVSSSWLTAVVV